MINNKMFIRAWPVMVLLGIPLTVHFLPAIFGDPMPLGIMSAFFLASPAYTAIVGILLLWSFFNWYTRPGKSSMILTMVIGWGLCGFPGLVLLMLSGGPRG